MASATDNADSTIQIIFKVLGSISVNDMVMLKLSKKMITAFRCVQKLCHFLYMLLFPNLKWGLI